MVELLLRFAGGLGLFFVGLWFLRAGMMLLAGEQIQAWLQRFTRTPLRGFASGALSTALLHSSSAVSVMTISLTATGALPFRETIGVILGSNVGTTFTLELIALPIEEGAVFLAGAGLLLCLLPRLRALGMATGGVGVLLLGLYLIQSLAAPLSERSWFSAVALLADRHPLLALLWGLGITALLQSSSMSIALLMGLYPVVVQDGYSAVAYILGANVGTCITALLASLGTPDAAKKVALAHLMLNLAGAALFFPLMPLWSPAIAKVADSPATFIAHVQLFYNLACSLMLLPLVSLYARWVEWCYRRLSPWWP